MPTNSLLKNQISLDSFSASLFFRAALRSLCALKTVEIKCSNSSDFEG